MDAVWRRRADAFWAGELGVSLDAFLGAGFRVLERRDGAEDLRAILVGTPTTTIVSVPHGRRTAFEDAGLDFAAIADAPRAGVAARAAHVALDVRGPAYLGYWTRSSSSAPGRIVSPLDPVRDRQGLEALRESAPAEWEEAGFDARSVLVGAREAGTLVAVAGYEPWGGIAHLQVFCQAGHRQRGFGTAVLATALAHALAERLLPQYRARDGNLASRALAAGVGFEEYGWMATIRLRA